MGLFSGQSVLINITLAGISSVASSLGLVDRARELAAGMGLVEKLAIRCSSPYQDIDQLSGGNQQTVVLSRWLLHDCQIYIFDEPTRGVDVGAKSEIYRLMEELVIEDAPKSAIDAVRTKREAKENTVAVEREYIAPAAPSEPEVKTPSDIPEVETPDMVITQPEKV